MKIIGKLILSIITIIFVSFILIGSIFSMFFDVDVMYIEVISIILCLSLLILILLFIWKPKNIKKILTIICPITLLSGLVIIYYLFFSAKIEPLIYLHNKYKINYSDLKITKTTRFYYPILCLDDCVITYRGSIFLYKGIEIKTFYDYDDGWNDNYNENH